MPLNWNRAEFVRSAAKSADFPRDARPQIVFAGRSNVGKSSVINRLLGRKNFARVGNSPGKTTHINYFLIDEALYLVDLPGYGYAKVSQAEKARWGRLIIDIRIGHVPDDPRGAHRGRPAQAPLPTTAPWPGGSSRAAGPSAVVANKLDKLKKSEIEPNLQRIRETLALDGETPLIPFSAEKGEGKEALAALILEHQEGAR